MTAAAIARRIAARFPDVDYKRLLGIVMAVLTELRSIDTRKAVDG